MKAGKLWRAVGALAAAAALHATPALGAHPLITDDAGTQGKGRLQLELNAEIAADREGTGGGDAEETALGAAAVLSWGIREDADLVAAFPYGRSRLREAGRLVSDEGGLGDVSLELKWRFLEGEGFALAVKPGLTLPTGDEAKGLGTGGPSWLASLIATADSGRWLFHWNLGLALRHYSRAEDRDALRKEIWSASAAAEYAASESVTVVADLGAERNAEKGSGTHPAFALAGLIYRAADHTDLDLGVKAGLNDAEADWAVLVGVARRF
ncbi:MAG: transporter [Thermodesulfovibrionales bacterium]